MQLATSCIIWFSNSTSTRSGARSCQHAACAGRGKILLKLEVKCTARGARNMNENSWRKKQYLTNMRNVCRILDFGESSFDDQMAHILSGVEQLEVGCLCVKSMISLFSVHQGNLYQIQTLAKENLQIPWYVQGSRTACKAREGQRWSGGKIYFVFWIYIMKSLMSQDINFLTKSEKATSIENNWPW